MQAWWFSHSVETVIYGAGVAKIILVFFLRRICQIFWSKDPAMEKFLEEQADDDGIHREKPYFIWIFGKWTDKLSVIPQWSSLHFSPNTQESCLISSILNVHRWTNLSKNRRKYCFLTPPRIPNDFILNLTDQLWPDLLNFGICLSNKHEMWHFLDWNRI